MSAEIISLCRWRAAVDEDPVIDLRTAIDVAIRDLWEVQAQWGTELGLERLTECRSMLRTSLEHS